MDRPTWSPDPDAAAATRMAAFVRAADGSSGRTMASSVDVHAWSLDDPAGFWSLVWEFFGVVGDPGDVAHVPTALPDAVFFPRARLNLAE